MSSLSGKHKKIEKGNARSRSLGGPLFVNLWSVARVVATTNQLFIVFEEEASHILPDLR